MTNTGSATQNDALSAARFHRLANRTAALDSTLSYHTSQAETNVMIDAGHGFTLRAGYRYIWGTANDAVVARRRADHPCSRMVCGATSKWGRSRGGPPEDLSQWRGRSRAKAEARISAPAFTITSASAVWAAFRFWKYWQVSGDFRIMNNHNPLAGSSYKFLTHQESLTLIYTPRNKTMNVDLTYEHCGYHSNVMSPGPSDSHAGRFRFQ